MNAMKYIVPAIAVVAAVFVFKSMGDGPASDGNQVSLAWESAPRSIDPRYAVDANSQYLENLVHCSLVDFDANGTTIGDLAASWEWRNPTTLAVALKDGTFANGQKVTAQDVKATYEFYSREGLKNPSPRKAAFANLKSVAVESDKNVVFNVAEPDSTFITNLVVGIMPAALGGGDMIDDPAKIVGCGPFKLAASTNTGLELAASEKYSLGQAAKTDKITIKIVKDETTRFAKLRAGEIDIVQNAIGRDTLENITKQYPDLKVLKKPGLNTAYLGFNMRDKVVGNVNVRKAIAYAIDRDKIIKYILKDLAVPASTLLTPNDKFFNKNVASINYNPKNAKALLDAAGFTDPDGDGPAPRFELTYKTTTNTTRVALAKAISADLRKIGIKVNVQPLEWGRVKADVEAGKVQMWSLKWVGFKDPDIFRFCFATESFPPNGGNRGWYSNKELDGLLAQAKSQTDFAKRQASYARAQEIVADELPYVFLWHEENFAVVRKDVEDFEIYADGRLASLAKVYRK